MTLIRLMFSLSKLAAALHSKQLIRSESKKAGFITLPFFYNHGTRNRCESLPDRSGLFLCQILVDNLVQHVQRNGALGKDRVVKPAQVEPVSQGF